MFGNRDLVERSESDEQKIGDFLDQKTDDERDSPWILDAREVGWSRPTRQPWRRKANQPAAGRKDERQPDGHRCMRRRKQRRQHALSGAEAHPTVKRGTKPGRQNESEDRRRPSGGDRQSQAVGKARKRDQLAP